MLRRLWWPLLLVALLPALAEAQVTYLDRVTLSRDADFRARVEYALVNTALGVVDEAPTTPNHTLRMTTAKEVLESPTEWANRLALAVVYHLASATPTDAQVQTATNLALAAFAKVRRQQSEVMP